MHTPLPGQAVLHYGDGDFTIMRPGQFVICAISGRQVPLDALRYWNPRTQEAYAGPEEATIAWKRQNNTNQDHPTADQTAG